MSISGIGGGLALPNMFSGSAAGSAEKLQKSPEEEFLEYARQSPAERIRAAILEEMGISEDELEAMSPEARAAVEKAIADRIKDRLLAEDQPRPGSIVDVTV